MESEMATKRDKNLVIFVDPISTEYDPQLEVAELDIPKRTGYFGNPVSSREPLAIEYLAAYIETCGYQAKVLVKERSDIDSIIEYIGQYKDDLMAVCFSLHSSYLVLDVLEMAKKCKQIMPQIPIIVGGYHPSGAPDYVQNEQIDFAVIGEGEEICRELLDALYEKKDTSGIKGIAYTNDDKEVIVNSREGRARIDFSKLPWPKRDKKILEVCYSGPLSYPASSRVALLTYSRGCPYSCNFCASPCIWDKGVRYRDPKDVVKEIDFLMQEHNITSFRFCDLTFNSHKNRVIELCAELDRLVEKRGVGDDFGWSAFASTTKMDEELLYRMSRAGCRKLDYGIESVVDETLKQIKPWQTFETVRDTLDLTIKQGILVRGLLMIGYPWESWESLKRTEEIVMKLPIDQLRICFVVPFPGTKICDEWKDLIIAGFEDFSTDIPVVKCENLTTEELKEQQLKILKQYYNSEHYHNHVKRQLANHPVYKETYIYFLRYLKHKGLISNDHGF